MVALARMKPLLVMNVVGLTPGLLRYTPRLAALGRAGFTAPLGTLLPAVTCPTQATMLTTGWPISSRRRARHRHHYHGVFAPNHKLRRAVTALAIGNIGKRGDATTGGHGGDGHGTEGCCDANHATLKPRSHDTSRIAWAKLMARVGEEFPPECPACGGDIRLIAFITEPGPIWKILTHLGEPLEPPLACLGNPDPCDMKVYCPEGKETFDDDRHVFQASPDELPEIDIHSL